MLKITEDLQVSMDISEASIEQCIIQMHKRLPGIPSVEGDLILRVHPTVIDDAVAVVTELERIYQRLSALPILNKPRFRFFIRIDFSLKPEGWCLEHVSKPTKERYDTVKIVIYSKGT